MAQNIAPPQTIIKVVPRDGELEITLNININLDGTLMASSDEAKVSILKKEETPDKADFMIPDFSSGGTLPKFGLKT